MITGAQIRSARLAQGITQAQLAGRSNITRSYLNHIEAGRRPVQPELITHLHALGLFADGVPHRITVYVDGAAIHLTLDARSITEALRAAAALPTSAWTAGEDAA